jgi:hypothetical protein
MFAACGWLFSGCNDAEYNIRDNSLYISEAATAAKSATVFMEVAGADVKVNVRLAKATDVDVPVGILIDTTLLDKYNAANSTEYIPLPVDSTDFAEHNTVTIPAGETGATLNIHVKYFDPKGKRYAIPVVLGNVEGSIPKSAVQDKLIYLISVPLIQPVPRIKTANTGLQANPTDVAWNLHVTEWSFEWWMLNEGYTAANQVVFTNDVVGAHEIFSRLGDGGISSSYFNYLQIKTLGNGDIHGKNDLVANTWYHWALVYDGVAECIIYRDGEIYARGAAGLPAEGYIQVDKIFFVYGGMKDTRQLSQMRFWNKALTQSEIKNRMFETINPDNYKAELIGYWPCDEGSGNTLTDITGNGHDVPVPGTLEWLPNIRFAK